MPASAHPPPPRHDCVELWAKLGVSRAFLSSHSGGVSWGCDACAEPDPSPLVVDECTTCGGYPPGHPECLGVPWGQTFEDIPHAIWYNVVTITTVGYGDVYPETMRGRLLGLFIIIAGVAAGGRETPTRCLLGLGPHRRAPERLPKS